MYIFLTRIIVRTFAIVKNDDVMRVSITIALASLIMIACTKEDPYAGRGLDYNYGRELKHEKIVLGSRLENPYKTENMQRALYSLYPTKADRVELKSTNLYVRFLPADENEFDQLMEMNLELLDHPLDFDILVEGDWYHDPEVPEDKVTWQYAVVSKDFVFPDIRYEIIDECYLSENDPATRASDIDWSAVEQQSYQMTGNADMLQSVTTKASSKVIPSGRITIVDENAHGGKPFGVSGVQVSCNSFVKFDYAYTDRDGYYQMAKEYSSDLRYRLVFKNKKDFSIGFNLILIPASVSTLGESGPDGVNVTVTDKSETKLFQRCVVNNAAYEFISRCSRDDLGITPPPSDTRIWLFPNMKASSATMMHHGASVDSGLIGRYLGSFASLLECFLPDVTIGLSGKTDYRSIYSSVCHELAHCCHFRQVGTEYWNVYIRYIMESYLLSGGSMYGSGMGQGAGNCCIGEMWAYYLESKMYKDRYGGSFPSFGTSYWFYPQIFRYLDERGMSCSDIFSVLDKEIDSEYKLKYALMSAFPSKRTIIEQVFSRY